MNARPSPIRTAVAWSFAAMLLVLAACSSSPAHRIERHAELLVPAAPSFGASLPAALQRDETPEASAPNQTVLPIGFGLTASPTTVLFTASVDLPLDQKLTFGPSLHFGYDEDVNIASLTGQLKYYLPEAKAELGSFALFPYLTAGVGMARVDKDGRSSDTGLLLNAGVGLRYLTGANYRLGSELRLNVLPDDVAGESFFVSIELFQVVVSF